MNDQESRAEDYEGPTDRPEQYTYMNNNTANNNNQNEATDQEHTYDKLPHKNDKILRITFININGIPKNKEQPKNKLITDAIIRTETDIMGMTETNLRWNKLALKDQWTERTKGVWECSHHTIGHNLNDPGSTEFQPGGCITLSLGPASHRVTSKGMDDAKLGRWTWTRYKGTNNISLRVITAYRPCKITNAGPSTVHSQHQRYLDNKDDHRQPREAMLDDLLAEIEKWQTEGDQIILLMDCNEDIRGRRLRQKMLNVGLTEAITSNADRQPAPTHSRGRTAIDGIFISSTIHPRASGYLPFGDFPSDHRAIWMDISQENAFGSNTMKVIRPQARKLKSNDPKVRNKFISDYERFLTRNNAVTQLYSIQQSITIPLNKTLAQKLEHIFKIRQEGIIEAESKCRKLRMGAVPYSEDFRMASKKIELWRAVESKKKGCKYSMSKLRRLETSLKIHNCLSLPAEEIKHHLQESYKEYWKVKKDAKKHRLHYLERKAQDIADENGIDSNNVYKQLMQREDQRLAARRVKYTLRKLRGGSVMRIEVPTEDGQWREVTTKEGIEKGCIKENIKKYRQTEDTPCMTYPLCDALGYTGLTKTAEDILQGSYVYPAGLGQYQRELLQEFQRKENLTSPPPESIMTTQDFIQGWKKMKEPTSSGKSGLHFGHLKACTFSPLLSNFEATLAHIPYTTGYVPNAWKQGVCCMIKKKSNVDRVTKLRTIVLTEADYNFCNKKLGREAIQHAELNSLIAPEQYGSRKGKSAIEHALNKRLSYDLIRQRRRPGALCSNDAKSCYDRIIHSIVSLAFQRLGLPKAPVQCMLKCIQHMKHYIRTSFGDSEEYFSSEHRAVPFQGILQGNGAAPTIWVLVSTPLLNMLRTAMNGAHIISPISSEQSHIVGYAFVDDTDLITIDMRENHRNTEDIMIDMQEGIDRWEGGLRTTGGAIVPEKSWVYPIDFTFDTTGKWKYKSVEEIGAQFSVRDETQTRINLTQVEPNEGRCTLGVFLSPDGNDKAAIEDLRQKAMTWRDHIRCGHLNATEARLATDSTIMKSLEYPLLALNLSDKDCKSIMTPVLEASLTKSHVCRNFPRAVVYGPASEKGLGMKNLYTTKGLTQISAIIQHINDLDSITGTLLRAGIEMAKIETGLGRDIFTCNYGTYEMLLTECWIKNVWKFTWEKNLLLRERTTKNLDMKRENDAFIMEDIIATNQFSKSELQHINRCRIYLQVATLSDIVSGDGNHFQQLAYRCEHDTSLPHRHIWPNQPRPGVRSRRLWKRAIKIAYPRTGTYLIHRVGRWLNHTERTDWTWFYNQRTQMLYQRHLGSWRAYHRTSRAGRLGHNPTFKYHNQAISLPPYSWRATVIILRHRKVMLTGSSPETPPQQQETPEEEEERAVANISHLMLEDQRLKSVTLAEIIQGLRDGTIKVVSDGSFDRYKQLGTAAWVIATNRTSYIIGRHWTPGEAIFQCSHRSELSGILGAIIHINTLCKQNQVAAGSIELKCDGEGAVKILQHLHKTINPNRKHFDLLTSINIAIMKSPLHWTFSHVYGHQDGKTDISSLDDWAYLNVIADDEAKKKMTHILSTVRNWNDNRPLLIPYETCTLHSQDENGKHLKVASNLRTTVYNHIHTRDIRNYWEQKGLFNLANKRTIDWESSAKACEMIAKPRGKWLAKWVSGVCGVGKQLKMWKWQSHSNCPRCLSPNETVEHVIRCRQTEATDLWDHSINELRAWLIANNCNTDMGITICNSLAAWHDDVQLTTAQTPGNSLIQAARQDQRRIGWYGMLNGFTAKRWRGVQREHLLATKSTKSAILWMAKFQRRIWIIPWTMWDHRNQFLHQTTALHPTEIAALSDAISVEWNVGLDNLPRNRYSHLFRGNLQHRLNNTPYFKQLWLASVWSARDSTNRRLHLPCPAGRDAIALKFYERWKKKIRS